MKKPALLFITLSIAAALCGCGDDAGTSSATSTSAPPAVSATSSEEIESTSAIPEKVKTKLVEVEGCRIEIPEDWRANTEQIYFSDARAPGGMLYIRRDETVDLGDTTETMVSRAKEAMESLALSRAEKITIDTAPHEVIRNGYRTISATYYYMVGTSKKPVCIDFIQPPTGDTLICEFSYFDDSTETEKATNLNDYISILDSIEFDEAPTPTTATTKKPKKTPTPEPTPTEEPLVPDPAVYEGSGDSVIDVEPPSESWVLYVKGNAESDYFSVKGYDEDGEYTELFVSDTDPYEGITLDPELATRTLEIEAGGPWHIELRPITSVEKFMEIPQTITGKGDSVLAVIANGAKRATITGNESESYFSVKSYGTNGYDLLVSATEPYSGTVMVKGDPVIIVVTASDEWSITLE